MKDFEGKVAVVTGGASGIGYALAEYAVRQGMKVALADVEAGALGEAAEKLRGLGGEALAVRVDVSKADEVEDLARQVYDTYGATHLLFNNAGVGGGTGAIWEEPLATWEWTLGVNLWGVIHGVRSFVPRMLRQNSEGHIVNTASMAGLVSGPGLGVYKVSKFGVVTLSETLSQELTMGRSKLKVSVLCPGWVRTGIIESERNRPEEYRTEPASVGSNQRQSMVAQMVQKAVAQGKEPAEVAGIVFDAIREEKFYILTHPEMKPAIKTRMEDILQERNPTPTSLLA